MDINININDITNRFAEGLYELPQSKGDNNENTIPSRYSEGTVFLNDIKRNMFDVDK